MDASKINYWKIRNAEEFCKFVCEATPEEHELVGFIQNQLNHYKKKLAPPPVEQTEANLGLEFLFRK